MGTEVAFGSRVVHRVHVDGIVRTRLHARLTADTSIVIDVDDTIWALVHRACGTDVDARRFGAMVAAENRKVPPRRGELPDLDVFDPGAEHSQGNIVLGLAGGGARMTA